jgi:hypothetical protein
MPSNVDLFNLKHENVLQTMSLNELVAELEKTYAMLAEIRRYQMAIRKVRDARIKAG